jgi:DNA invertase Pin-like site-specific DNA recombinase
MWYDRTKAAAKWDDGRPLRAVLYLRVSTPKQIEEGYGYERQHKILPEFCERKGWPVVGIYEEKGITGDGLEQRPAFMRLLGNIPLREFDVGNGLFILMKRH